MSQINYLVRQTPNLSSETGTVGFPQHKFTKPPFVLHTLSVLIILRLMSTYKMLLRIISHILLNIAMEAFIGNAMVTS